MPPTFGADHGSARFGSPALLAHGDNVFHLHAIAGLQFVELLDLTIAGGHDTAPDGPWAGTTQPNYHHCAKCFDFGKLSLFHFAARWTRRLNHTVPVP